MANVPSVIIPINYFVLVCCILDYIREPFVAPCFLYQLYVVLDGLFYPLRLDADVSLCGGGRAVL